MFTENWFQCRQAAIGIQKLQKRNNVTLHRGSTDFTAPDLDPLNKLPEDSSLIKEDLRPNFAIQLQYWQSKNRFLSNNSVYRQSTLSANLKWYFTSTTHKWYTPLDDGNNSRIQFVTVTPDIVLRRCLPDKVKLKLRNKVYWFSFLCFYFLLLKSLSLIITFLNKSFYKLCSILSFSLKENLQHFFLEINPQLTLTLSLSLLYSPEHMALKVLTQTTFDLHHLWHFSKSTQ